MPAASSIYWDSVDSQRSSGSSGDAGSARQYVDPWDLENYAYLRRHSIATPPQKHQQPPRTSYSRVSHRNRELESEYWYSPREPRKEPGYHAPASVEELYFGPPRQTAQGSYYQPIYEDEIPRYSAPVYAPLSDLDHTGNFEDSRMKEVLPKRKASRATLPGRNECIYHSTPNEISRVSVEEIHPRMTKNEECYVEVIPPSKLGLNTYGHLKIDYSNSWDSLHRKISK